MIVRDGKGKNDRVMILPDSLIPPLKAHLKTVRAIHQMEQSGVKSPLDA